MSGASEATVADQTEEAQTHQQADHEAHIKVLRGQPTDEEMAALMAILGTAGGGGDAGPVVRERNLWGHPVDKLRYSIYSWQRVTLLERTHMRR
ncbi:acyl-CoA carboxylase subunit epsilon [Mycolicibacterium peregrinum]|uniref:Acyl-CoA carboxylase subunit epsilon n=1 Tax=Mycolicibacterium peregrinum TaxID=43304 RepID=A0A4Z0HNT7_MYCPR|nr:acyl-CoA carboxylase subunit epsilon [Mycolicibacterium peregrinum]TGB39621.1 acyl-CoA carboxylase subunit epsilon [Mycolicibacterium peregrinum]TGB39994.1 acyl-CoA carboxylase subunit epsilon [Mycolicibacterium peregrinum]